MKKVKSLAVIIILNRITKGGFISDYLLPRLSKKCNIPVAAIITILNTSDAFERKATGWRVKGFSGLILKYYKLYIKIYNKRGDFKQVCNSILESLAIHKLNQQVYAAANKNSRNLKNKKSLVKAKLVERLIECRTSARVMGKFMDVSHVKANEVLNNLVKKKIAVFKDGIQLSKKMYLYKSINSGFFPCMRYLVELNRPLSDGNKLGILYRVFKNDSIV